jgi:hypothetical protein
MAQPHITYHTSTVRSKFKLDELCSQSEMYITGCTLKELWTYISDRLETPWKRQITVPPAAQWSWMERAADGTSWN